MTTSFYLILIINILFCIFFNKIQKKLNIFDKPDTKRKFHTKVISSAGGVLFFLCILIYFIINLLGLDQNSLSLRENFSLSIVIISFFVIGVYDDKFSLNVYPRLLLSFIFILSFLLLNDDFILRELTFSFLNSNIQLKNFSILFTILCSLLFINACNMFDGVDLQFGLYVLLLSVFFYTKNILPNLQVIIIICCISFLYFNYNKKLFIGNNGTLIVGLLFSLIFIKFYNSSSYYFYADEIFLYMAIPGFDLIRVSFLRLLKGRNMFSPDRNHLHHLLIKIYTPFKSVIITQFLIIIPVIFSLFTKQYLMSCLVSLLFYIIIITQIKFKT
jgi:UDP-GlcNAc:undecaprenyl-phosphate GlcNAc-1-phosphate transferase